jgi:hypothetical protein
MGPGTLGQGDERGDEDTKQYQTTSSEHLAYRSPAAASITGTATQTSGFGAGMLNDSTMRGHVRRAGGEERRVVALNNLCVDIMVEMDVLPGEFPG